MKKSKLETNLKNSKHSLFKRINDYVFKLTAYIIDGIPYDKNVIADNCSPSPNACYKGDIPNPFSHRYKL